MTDTVKLNTELREKAGKGASRATRRAGRVPAVIYGDKKERMPVDQERMNGNSLLLILHTLYRYFWFH